MPRYAFILSLCASLADVVYGAAASRWSDPGPCQVRTVLENWTDSSRGRVVPVKGYLPSCPENGPFPVVLFSHGLGGSREAGQYLGKHWASHGYVAVHLQHPGSDTSVVTQNRERFSSAMKEAANAHNSVERARDVQFALNHLEKLNQGAGPWHRLLDLSRVGMCGHSFGAQTTLLVSGQRLGAGSVPGGNFRDPRVDAAVALSPPVPMQGANLREAFREVTIPVLHMTGTLDDSPIGNTKAADRRLPYDSISTGGQILVTFEGGDHMIFSGRETLRPRDDKKFHMLIQEATTAFWDSWLRNNPAAKQWLTEGQGMRSALGSTAAIEMK